MKANSTVNLVPFGEDIMELRMRENRDFIVPVNILIPFACVLCPQQLDNRGLMGVAKIGTTETPV